MAQTPQPGETGATETPPPAGGQAGGIFSNPTTLLLLALLVGFILWNRRKRTEIEARMQAQRREREETAQQSAMNVAHIMRRSASPEDAQAAASEGLASAARMPEAAPAAADEERALVLERAEATAEAERAAEKQAARAAEAADLAGESVERRVAAAEAAAEEARADTADASRASAEADVAGEDSDGAATLEAAMRELDSEVEVPLGAIAGDGTAVCPPGYPVKGNGSSRIYHVPGQVSYPPTIAEFCFASAEAAEAAGFRQSRARERRAQK
jgi:micrococcal nuclease